MPINKIKQAIGKALWYRPFPFSLIPLGKLAPYVFGWMIGRVPRKIG